MYIELFSFIEFGFVKIWQLTKGKKIITKKK